MAGDWIKMRVDLGDDPAVIGVAADLDIAEDLVVGKLHRLWSWADKHTVDGTTNGVTPKWVDRFVASQGFSDALCKHGWLGVDGDRLIFPNFDRHNGASAKSRAEATIRQRLSRKNRDNGVTGLQRVVTPAPFVRFVLERDGHHCVYCGWVPGRKEKLGVDHLIPLTRGGKDALENLVSCCPSCNNEKNDRTPEEFGLLPTFLPDGVTYVSQQIRDKRVTETGPEKRREEKNIKDQILSADADPWTVGKEYLIANGVSKSNAGSIIGKWAKDNGQPAVISALQASIDAKPAQPIEFITAILQNRPKKFDPVASNAAWLRSQQ